MAQPITYSLILMDALPMDSIVIFKIAFGDLIDPFLIIFSEICNNEYELLKLRNTKHE